MTDPYVSAFDRLDNLHRTHPLPVTCYRCGRTATTSTDHICGSCRLEIRHITDWGTA